ncbi:MAG: 1-acyl-sn-glycerol-3-phosphate acyltransferase [Alphaproteobacteria bacterium]|nr:1-acyl-sn-glycerol-3-phosphate acyltransferase [Alphaproteobacteria bacterium]
MSDLLRVVRRAATTPVDPSRLDQIDAELLDVACPAVDAFCRAWFDLEIQGADHLPDGPALVVGNHNAGVAMIEALGFGARMYLEGRMTRPWHALAHDAIVATPLLGPFLVRAGALKAGHAVADAAFADGRKVLVFPGGNAEAFRPWSARHRIDFADHKGFVRLALRHGVPIVPTVFHGGHTGLFIVSDNRRLARAIGAKRFLRSDTWPLYLGLPWGVALGPWFHLPLPVKCTTRVLPPIPMPERGVDAANDPILVDALYDQVVTAMQAGMDALAAESEGTVPSLRRRVGRALRRAAA